MSSLRLEIEKTICLRFPEKNGEAIVRFEESMEIPQEAERLMRGYYKNPDKIKRSFQELHAETSSLVEILLPRRSKLRGWSEELPERPQVAELFVSESAQLRDEKEQQLALMEQELLQQLQESVAEEMFPIPSVAFGCCSHQEGAVKMFLKPLGKLAELLQFNPDLLRQALRVYHLYLLLIVVGLDLDGRICAKERDETTTQFLARIYTLRYLQTHSPDLVHYFNEWLRVCGEKQPRQGLLSEQYAEKLRTATVFWRRKAHLGWDECWKIVSDLDER